MRHVFLFIFLRYFLRYSFVFFCPGCEKLLHPGGVANMDEMCPYGVVISFVILFSALELQQSFPSVMDRISLLVRVQMESDLAADGVAEGWFLLTTPPVSDGWQISSHNYLKLNALFLSIGLFPFQ